MFHVFSLRPWKRTYATGCVAAAWRATTFDARVIGVSTDTTRGRCRSRNASVSARSSGFHPRAVAELDERDERVDSRANARELGERLGRLHEAGVVLQRGSRAASRRARAARATRGTPRTPRRPARPRDPSSSSCAFTWKMNSGGVRCAQRPVTAGIGKVVEGRVDLDRVEALGVVAAGGPATSRRRAGTRS